MKTLSVSISEAEFSKFGLKNETLSFSDFIDIVSKELTRQTLQRCHELAEQYGLSTMTMEEITQEVEAVRRNAKDNS